MRLPWTTLIYKSRKKPQEPLRRRLREIAATYVRYGYRRLTVLLKREGWKIGAKRVYRLAIPLTQHQTLKFSYSRGADISIGGDYRMSPWGGETPGSAVGIDRDIYRV